MMKISTTMPAIIPPMSAPFAPLDLASVVTVTALAAMILLFANAAKISAASTALQGAPALILTTNVDTKGSTLVLVALQSRRPMNSAAVVFCAFSVWDAESNSAVLFTVNVTLLPLSLSHGQAGGAGHSLAAAGLVPVHCNSVSSMALVEALHTTSRLSWYELDPHSPEQAGKSAACHR